MCKTDAFPFGERTVNWSMLLDSNQLSPALERACYHGQESVCNHSNVLTLAPSIVTENGQGGVNRTPDASVRARQVTTTTHPGCLWNLVYGGGVEPHYGCISVFSPPTDGRCSHQLRHTYFGRASGI